MIAVVLFGLIGVFLYLIAFGIFGASQSAIHEIEAGIAAIVGTLFLLIAQVSSLHYEAQKKTKAYMESMQSRLGDIAARLQWFKEKHEEQLQREEDARLSRIQR